MGWNKKGIQLDVEAIIQQAELIWPPHVKTVDGFEHITASNEVRVLKKRKKEIPLDSRDWRAAFAWRNEFLDDLKRFGQISLAAHHHPKEWKKIMNRVKTIRQEIPDRQGDR